MDIIEGVNKQTTNQYTLHSGGGNGTCTLDRTADITSSNILGTNCVSSQNSNSGCAFADTDTSSFGEGFNKAKGAVFAHLWDNTGIKIWRFARDKIPADVAARNPDPSSWPTPQAAWSSKTCDMTSHFFDHELILDTTICGDWAGAAFGSDGCSGSCSDLVSDPKNFASELETIQCYKKHCLMKVFFRRSMEGQLHCCLPTFITTAL